PSKNLVDLLNITSRGGRFAAQSQFGSFERRIDNRSHRVDGSTTIGMPRFALWAGSPRRACSGYEFLDPIDEQVQHFLVESLEQMIVAGQLDIVGAGNVHRQVSAGVDRDQGVSRTMHQQHRHPYRVQNATAVELIVCAHQGENRARAGYRALQPAEPSNEVLIMDSTGRGDLQHDSFAP